MGMIESRRKDKMNSNHHILTRAVELRRCQSVNTKVKYEAREIRKLKGRYYDLIILR